MGADTGSTAALDRAATMAPGEPHTGADIPEYLCGHPKTNANTYWSRHDAGGPRYPRCRECVLVRNRADYQPQPCGTCGKPLGSGGHAAGYHSGVCEPLTCTCGPDADPSPVWDDTYGHGECRTCRRPVPDLMWSDHQADLEAAAS